jgi:uncharacterized membrane protein YcaP (DUF421 family)
MAFTSGVGVPLEPDRTVTEVLALLLVGSAARAGIANDTAMITASIIAMHIFALFIVIS